MNLKLVRAKITKAVKEERLPLADLTPDEIQMYADHVGRTADAARDKLREKQDEELVAFQGKLVDAAAKLLQHQPDLRGTFSLQIHDGDIQVRFNRRGRPRQPLNQSALAYAMFLRAQAERNQEEPAWTGTRVSLDYVLGKLDDAGLTWPGRSRMAQHDSLKNAFAQAKPELQAVERVVSEAGLKQWLGRVGPEFKSVVATMREELS